MFFRKRFRPLASLIAAAGVLSTAASHIHAQFGSSSTITNITWSGKAPNNQTTWPAGPDFATDVLQDPWDFCNPEDLSPLPDVLPGWSNLQVHPSGQPCQTGGTAASTNATITPMYRGFYEGTFGSASGTLNPGRNGRNFPIDTKKYQKFAYRMSSSRQGAQDGGRFIWYHNPYEDPNGDAGCLTFNGTNSAGSRIYSFDMTAPPAPAQSCATASSSVRWAASAVRELEFSPNVGTSGDDYFYSWARLTYGDSVLGAAIQTLSWSGGTATVSVLDASGVALTVATNQNSPYNFNYGVLPPGNYTLQIGSATRAFTVNTPPLIQITDPTEAGGENYATKYLGDGWEMNNSFDIPISAKYPNNNIQPIPTNYVPTPADFTTFAGIMTATSGCPGGAYGCDPTDAQIALLNSTNNSKLIDASRYRFLTYRMAIDATNWDVARFSWTAQPYLDGTTATTTKSIIVFKPNTPQDNPYHTYTIDLSKLSFAPDGGLNAGSEAWSDPNARYKAGLRFDPGEAANQKFHIEYVRLAAMAETSGGGYTFHWQSYQGSGAATVSLYLDTDQDPTNGKGTLMCSGVAMSMGQCFGNASAMATGDYWVYAEATDSYQTYGHYSSGQIHVGGYPDPRNIVDAPAAGQTITLGYPFFAGGWAIDLGALSGGSGTGVDDVQLWAIPPSGDLNQAYFLGQATYGVQRSDVGNAFGAQFTNSGWSMFATMPTSQAAGQWDIYIFAHDTVANQFVQSAKIRVTVSAPVPDPRNIVDAPAAGNVITRGSAFFAGGWAIDLGALGGPSTGTGVSAVHLWAIPAGASNSQAYFLGQASYGIQRSDVGNAFGAQFTDSGWSMFGTIPSSQAAGQWDIYIFAYDTIAGGFVQSAKIRVTVQ